MKEIKFRAWSEDSNGMIFQFPSSFSIIQNQEDGTFFCGGEKKNGDWEEPKLMQFTGIVDKNKKQIYEGDIISSLNSEGKEIRHAIEFEDGGFQLKHVPYVAYPDGYAGRIYQQWITACEKKIIGNIYENPELLSEKAG